MAEEDTLMGMDAVSANDGHTLTENTGADDMSIDAAASDLSEKQGAQRILEILKRIRLSSNLALKYVIHTLLEKPNKMKVHSKYITYSFDPCPRHHTTVEYCMFAHGLCST